MVAWRGDCIVLSIEYIREKRKRGGGKDQTRKTPAWEAQRDEKEVIKTDQKHRKRSPPEDKEGKCQEG